MPTVRVHFKDSKSRAQARWLIMTSKEEGFSRVVGNRPVRELIVDKMALKLFIKNGIKVYPPLRKGEKPSYKQELDMRKLLAAGIDS